MGKAWRCGATVLALATATAAAQTHGAKNALIARADQPPVSVPTAPPAGTLPQGFHDPEFGVRFQVPPGWAVSKDDGTLSSFHVDAMRAPQKAELRGVAMLNFNPYPESTFSGAIFYYSVERHAKKAACQIEATGSEDKRDAQEVSGLRFAHGHDEHGNICVEARDEVYTAYRKGSCYRFDLELNTFCSVSSGAQDLSDTQVIAIEDRMDSILRSVTLDWGKKPGKSGAPPIQPGAPTPPTLGPGTAAPPPPVILKRGAK